MTPTQRIAATVREEMRRKQRAPERLAALLNLSPLATDARLAGRVPFKRAELEAVARWLGVPLECFLGPSVVAVFQAAGEMRP